MKIPSWTPAPPAAIHREPQPPTPGGPHPNDGFRPSSGARKLGRIQQLLQGWTGRRDEAEILSLLSSASRQDLNHILQGLSLKQLLSDVDDHCWGPDHYQALLKLLSQTRVAELELASRVALVAALQVGHTHRHEERAVRNLFLATSGSELRELKLALDRQEGHRDLHQLIYGDLDNKRYRDQILQHFAEQAGPPREVKVLSDIDDTFYCNWVDPRYPKGTVYPGVRQYYREMDHLQPGAPEDLTFVTARPDDRIGLVKKSTKKSLRSRGLGHMVVLAGSVPSLLSSQLIAEKKLQRMDELRHLYPEFQLVFTGDSGQGDAICGLKAGQSGWGSYRTTLIHDVKNTSEAERQRYRDQGVYFFDTYVGAALEAQRQGLLELEGLVRVAQAACHDFESTAFLDENQRQQRKVELERDLARVNAQLPPDQAVTLGALKPLSALPLPELPELPPGG